MLSFLSRHSSLLLIIAAVCGFAFPSASAAVFPYLPYILFCLMLFTLLGMQQRELIKMLALRSVWLYAGFHSVFLSLVSCSIALLAGASASLTLAISAVAATGSLFATPAIARSVGLEPLKAMAITISSTLLMPVVLYVNLLLFQDSSFSLDMQSYLQRLVIFIFGPMLFSAVCYRVVPRNLLSRVHAKLSQVTILLVLAFPFGLIGPFREVFDQSYSAGIVFFFIGLAICALYFLAGYVAYARAGINEGLLAAITSANRNVLLTFTVAGSYLGPDFLILMGAIQLPTYCLPMLVKWLNRYLRKSTVLKTSASSNADI
ncbi:hypothetical protein BIT28_03550 [Photobacterium proteolyticum]|uniref:Bile acid:sodium symporter n=2 Tax=Photobacterium proteolyticum TaxID=1903952 RepID=A0A1Q9GAF3_9GAMM|nr:hypothetical protein [Photobacterium proteolyticum]OLQ71250.1 hypothetical protein BIT28_03550 [Photobacterium proteolyticum]